MAGTGGHQEVAEINLTALAWSERVTRVFDSP